jgi:hypothetical protein
MIQGDLRLYECKLEERREEQRCCYGEQRGKKIAARVLVHKISTYKYTGRPREIHTVCITTSLATIARIR